MVQVSLLESLELLELLEGRLCFNELRLLFSACYKTGQGRRMWLVAATKWSDGHTNDSSVRGRLQTHLKQQDVSF